MSTNVGAARPFDLPREITHASMLSLGEPSCLGKTLSCAHARSDLDRAYQVISSKKLLDLTHPQYL